MTGDAGPDAVITDGRPPPAEHEIDIELVGRLLAGQHPDLAELLDTDVGGEDTFGRIGRETLERAVRSG